MSLASRSRKWLTYATCAWAALFAGPHVWWAMGYSFAFPGGQVNHQLMMTTAWRYIYDLIVVLLSFAAAMVAVILLRPSERIARRWIPHAAAWFGSGMLTLRGVAGLIVDGTSDLIWWPTFLIGGLLLGGVAWFAHSAGAAETTA